MEKTTALLVFLCIIFPCKALETCDDEDDYGTYKFDYGVEDHHTGDIKSHHEVRLGKEVSGVYTVREPDGTIRVVKYTAGPHKGFQAEVQKVNPSDFLGTSGTSGSTFGSFSGLLTQTTSGNSGSTSGGGQGLELLRQNLLQGTSGSTFGSFSGSLSQSTSSNSGSTSGQGLGLSRQNSLQGAGTSGTSGSTFGEFNGQGLGFLGLNFLQGGASEQAPVILVPVGPNRDNN
ncbi:uncharacterized protein LOC103314415 [Tribolium castaneum]|uniref:Pupal cuticle protein Edg-84A-like Protein n=1 Tax=Tribolium castaneum TaxID=7070 RepID=D6X418_TRICA|nr:PREDICTED: uncharacterized protein LOC103314415 [Tribolium castaneum]EEZ97494.1 hypothetical protein TcasGA2_TC011337 [Tribolium castaneum]|eukprot:XP_015839442.1 PREDICTED: uncharacterized protein LOC103314415 [Tribolium castaneum]